VRVSWTQLNRTSPSVHVAADPQELPTWLKAIKGARVGLLPTCRKGCELGCAMQHYCRDDLVSSSQSRDPLGAAEPLTAATGGSTGYMRRI